MDQTQRPVPEKRPGVVTPEHAPDFESAPEGRMNGSAAETVAPPTAEATVVSAPVVPAVVPPTAPSLHQHIENILSEDLGPMYAALDPARQQQFKAEGERTATTIEGLMQSARVNVSKIVQVILRWLRLLPGVNQFYLEQEAKMKAAKLMALKQPPNHV